MSIKLMSYIWDIPDPELNGARLLTLLCLADHAGDDGKDCYPSIPRLAERSKVSQRQVTRVLQWLEAQDYIRILEKGTGRGRRTHYHLWLKGDVLSLNTRKGDKVSSYSQKQDTMSSNQTLKGDICDIKGDICDIERVTFETPITPILAEQPSVEPSIEPSGREAATQRTPQQELFGVVCEAVGWDYQTLSKEDRGQVAQACGILGKAGYTPTDVRQFVTQVWFEDWRWKRDRSLPTLKQLRQEIGKIRSVIPALAPPASNGKNLDGVASYISRQRSITP